MRKKTLVTLFLVATFFFLTSTPNTSVAASNTYGLDEEVDLLHVHGNASSSCYSLGQCGGRIWSAAGDYEQWTGIHLPPDDTKHQGTYYYNECSSCGDHGISRTDHEGDRCTRTVRKLSCSHTNEKVGTLKLIKTTDTGEYVLSINDNLSHASIVSYKWTGKESPSSDSYPSVRPNGLKATDVTNKATKSIVVPDFGTYTCMVTYKDSYSGATNVITFSYKVEDFDLTPPEVVSITEIDNNIRSNRHVSIKTDTDFNLQFDSQSNIFSEGDIKYRKEREYALHLSDNMNLSKLEVKHYSYYTETHNLSGSDATVDLTLSDNKIYYCKLYDAIGNTYDFDIDLSHFDNNKPTIEGFRFSTEDWTNEDIEVEVVATDNQKPVGYYLSTSENDVRDVSLYQESNKFTISQNGRYVVFVADEAGNLNRSGFDVNWIDKTSPYLTKEESFYLVSNNHKYDKKTELIPSFIINDKDARFATIHIEILDQNTEFKDMVSSAVKKYFEWERAQ